MNTVAWVKPVVGAKSLLLAAAVAVAAGLVLEPQRLVGGEQRYVIPPGTAQRAKAGESVEDVMPQRIQTVVGRPLVVENRDTERHIFGPFVLDPGQNWRRTFPVSGDVQMACSLYPATGFTIAVAPSPTPAFHASVLLTVWLILLTAVTAAAVGAVGVALGLGGARDSFGSQGPLQEPSQEPSQGSNEAPAYSGLRSGTNWTVRAQAVAALALGLLPALAVGAAALAVLRLTRTALWTDVIGNRTMVAWSAAVAMALAAAWFGRRLGRRGHDMSLSVRGHSAASAEHNPRREAQPATSDDRLFGAGLALVALACAWGPVIGAGAAVGTAVATAGGGLLGAAAVAGSRADAADRRRLGWHVAVPGIALLAIALPTGPATPPVQAVVAAPKLAVAIGLLWLVRTLSRRGETTAGNGVLAAGVLGVLFSVGLLYGAMLGHLNAVTLPIYGNPVGKSASSTARGAALWAAECAACHADASVYRDTPDDVLLQAMTFGQGKMPAYKYRLDIFERGDVVNYLRGP